MPFKIEPLDQLLKQFIQLVKHVFVRGEPERIPVSVELTDDEPVVAGLVEVADAQNDSPVSNATASVESVAEIDDEAAYASSVTETSAPLTSPQELPQSLADDSNSVADTVLSLETPATTPKPSKKTQQPRPRIDRTILANAMQKPQSVTEKPSTSFQLLTTELRHLLSQFDKSLDPLKLEKILREAMWYTDFIGELPIEHSMFDVLTTWLQHRYVQDNNGRRKVLIDRVQPATLVTSMVFSARYSNDEKRQFWDSYSRQVWGTEPSQMLSNRGRESFRSAVEKLENVTRMAFPIMAGVFVDYHVHRHVLLPAYLHDDVANWLKKHLRTLVQVEPRQAVADLLSDSSIQYLAPRVQAFLNSETTRDIAVNLLEQMVVAVQRFHDGETAEAIADLLINPIERSLWNELAESLNQQPTVRRNVRRADIQWVWARLEDDWQLRIRNFYSDQRPVEAVWRSSEKATSTLEIVADIEPWKRDDGVWYVDEVLLADGALKGQVSLYAAQNRELLTLTTPPLPAGDFIIYRPTQQEQFAIPVESSLGLSNGHWLISSTSTVEVRDTNDRIVMPIQSDIYIPQPLRVATGHKQAASYRLDFPAKILVNGQTFTIPRRTDSIGQPWLTRENQIQVSPSVPPAFTDNRIMLCFPDRADDLIRLSLVIQTAGFQRRWAIDELTTYLQTVEDGCQLDLSHVLPFQGGIFTIDVQRGLRSVLPAPLQCTLLPDVSIIPPDESRVYWQNELPTVWIGGISREQIGDSHLKVLSDDEGWRITWDDLRQSDFRLPIRFGEQQITLAWRLKRHYAFLDKLQSDQTIPVENLPEATLTIYGISGETVVLNVNGAIYTDQIKGYRRNEDRLIMPLMRHRLLDLIHEQKVENIELSIQMSEHSWQIGSILREKQATPSLPKQQPTRQPLQIQIQSDEEKIFLNQLNERLSAIHRSDEWISQYDLLPGWAVTGTGLLFCYTRGNYIYKLPVTPEVLSHRGQEGCGHVLLKLDGFRFERNYGKWGRNIRDKTELRIKIPLQEPNSDSSMAQLTDDDLDEMWCAYQCHYCGEVIGNRLSSLATYRHQQLHAHEQSNGAQFNDLFYGQPLRGDITIEKWNTIDKPIIPYSLYFDPEWHSVCEQAPTPNKFPEHPLKLEAYQFATLRHVVRRTKYVDEYNILAGHIALAQVRAKIKSHLKQYPLPMLSAVVRFLDALSQETSIDTQIVSLAVIHRLHDLRDPGSRDLEESIGVDKRQNQQFMQMAMRVCPELLLWAFSWVELFYVHAIG